MNEIVRTYYIRARDYKKETKDDRAKQREVIAQMKQERDEAQEKLREAEDGKLHVEPTLILDTDLEIGDVGIPSEPPRANNYIYTKWLETVLDDSIVVVINWFIGSKQGVVMRVLIEDYNTEGLVNDRKIGFEKPYYVSGTRSYESVSGTTETIFTLKPYMPKEQKDDKTEQ